MSGLRDTVHLFLDPAPGRLRNALILVLGVSIVVVCWETFRIPAASTACYIVLFVSRGERTSSIASAAGIVVLGTVAIFLAIGVTMLTLSDPPVRILAMAALTFGAMWMSRAARSGVPFFAAGFLLVYGLTVSDEIAQLGLQPFTVSNTTETTLPDLLFLPPEEALLRTLLWLVVGVLAAGTVVVVLNKALGRDPAIVLRRAVAERRDAVAAFCRGKEGGRARLERLVRRGSPELLALAGLAEKDHGPEQEPKAANTALVRALFRLMLACLALDELDRHPAWLPALAARLDDPGRPRAAPDDHGIGREMDRAIDHMEAARDQPADPAAPRPGFWADDALAADKVQFALKVTLSVMICTTLNAALDWQAIGTDVVTCFFVALGSVGESGHKMVLRLSGCLFGAALAIGSVIVLMPLMTGIVQLVALVGAVTFVAGWIASGSPRIAYSGWQTALAFYTVILSGFGPVTDMEGAKNRIVGILIGNVVSFVVFVTIWPVRVRDQLLPQLAAALSALGDLLAARRAPEAAREAFSAAILRMHDLLRDDLYEASPEGTVRMSEAALRDLQALVLPVSLVAATPSSHPPRGELADWFERAAGLAGGDRLRSLPLLPAPTDDDPSTRLLHRYLERLWRTAGLAGPDPSFRQARSGPWRR